jgi:hypothetical protein
MNMQIRELKDYLQTQFTDVKFYSGTIDRGLDKCIGIYPRGSIDNDIAIGGIENSSYGKLPISVLVHWSESSDQCENKANAIYDFLQSMVNTDISGRRISYIEMLNSGPIDLQRTDQNICKMVIRATVYYDRRVTI